MPLPVALITSAISLFRESKVGKVKVPGTSQTVGELTTNKTNPVVITIATFSINYILDNPDNSIPGWIMLGVCLVAFTLRDTLAGLSKKVEESNKKEV